MPVSWEDIEAEDIDSLALWCERRGKVGEVGGDDDGNEGDGGRGSGIVGGLLGRDATDFIRDLREGTLPGDRDEATDSVPVIDDRRARDAGMSFSSNATEPSKGRGDSCCASDKRGVESPLSSPTPFSDESEFLREVFEVVLGGRSLLPVCL